MNQETSPELASDAATSSSLTLLFVGPLMAAAAGGMGWGIRGQYGHEWGAMVPGALIGFTLVFLFCGQATSVCAARAIALTAIAYSFGGTMTYGQTVGLTHDTPLVGNDAAYRWGMLGLFLKGGLWAGFGAAFLGIGLSDKKYGWFEVLKLYGVLLVAVFLGIQLLNRPYVPGTDRELAWFFFPSAGAERVLPPIYFSDHWFWEPENQTMDPRPEVWGGLFLALATLVGYVWYFKRDRLARNMAFVGIVSGGLGFSLGQALQSKHSWTPGWLVDFDGALHSALPGIFPEEFFSLMGWNWWNMMETTFGAVMGFGLGLGLWANRRLIDATPRKDNVGIHPWVEWLLLAGYATGLYLWSVPRHDSVDWLGDFPLGMGLIPVVCIIGGRYWPYFYSLALVAVPISGITLKATDKVHVFTDRLLFFVLPIGLMCAAAYYFQRRGAKGEPGRVFARYGLILSAVTYLSLNFSFFGYPWATLPTGGRHTNNWIFVRCTELLIIGALALHRAREAPHAVGAGVHEG